MGLEWFMGLHRVCHGERQSLFPQFFPLQEGGERGKLHSDFIAPFYFDFWAKLSQKRMKQGVVKLK